MVKPGTMTDQVRSDWRPPILSELPTLRGRASQIGLDIETRDPNLLDLGPGAVRGDGYIVGVSLATPDGFKTYIPLRHEGGDNVESPAQGRRYIADQLKGREPKVGANIPYDLEFLRAERIKVNGPKLDIQIAEPLIDEDRASYSLEALSQIYLGESKEEKLMREATRTVLGISGSGKTFDNQVKSNLWRLPARFVGPYAEADAELPLLVLEKQMSQIKDQNLEDVFQLETNLIDLLVDMRFQGVRIDVDRAEEVRDSLEKEFDRTMRKIRRRIGFTPNVWASSDLVRACEKLGLSYLKTDKDNPSFPGPWLEKQNHVFFKLIVQARKLDRGGGVYVKGKILEHEHKGRIHPVLHSLRGSDYGTRSGRFSYSRPNLQQVPSRDEEIAPLIRSIFIPEKGCPWGCFDWSQQEPRVLVHYSFLSGFQGASEARDLYLKDADLDFHQMVADMASIKRKSAKTINLGLFYGMGKKKLAQSLGLPMSDAKRLFEIYHRRVPFVKKLSDRCSRLATSRGYIKTVLGRRRRFQLFGPREYEEGIKPLKKEEALKKFGPPVVRYFTYRAMNSLVQGTSAEMMKLALRDMHRAGYVPHITVHDEVDFSIQSNKQAREIRDIMLNCIELTVPSKVDVELGPNWGDIKEVKL